MTMQEFRSALREPPPEPLTVSLPAVLAAGRRRRVRRRAGVALVAAGVTTAAALAVPAVVTADTHPGGATQAGQQAGQQPRQQAAGPTGTSAAPRPKIGRPPVTDPRTGSTTGSAGRVGALIRTGEYVSGGERVFWFGRLDAAELPGHHLALYAGRRDRAGRLTLDATLNEYDGPDLAAGFHSVWLGEPAVGSSWIVVGYYVGPAARITGAVHGRPVAARTAVWSVNRQVRVFWFSPETGAPDPGVRSSDGILDRQAGLGPLTAYNATGARLPTLHNQISVG